MTSVPEGETAAAIHHDLVLPVSQNSGDDSSLVPLSCPDCGLVLYSDFVTNVQPGEIFVAMVEGFLHLLDDFARQKFTF